MMSKKGGVSIYIIIGLVILLVGTLTIAYSGAIKQFFVEVRNPEVKDVRLLVEECLSTTTRDALKFVALQGGYFEIPETLDRRGDYLPPPSIIPPPIKTPYWWSRGNSFIPSKERVEREIGKFVEQSLGECLNSEVLDKFKDITIGSSDAAGGGDGADSARENIWDGGEVEVSLGEKGASSFLTLPILIKSASGKEVTISSFRSEVTSEFLTLYSAAKSVMDQENEEAFFERLTMDMIASANGGGGSPSLPLDGFELSCGKGDVWSKNLQIIPAVQNLVKYNMHYFSFDGLREDYNLEFEDNRVIKQQVCEKENEGICTKWNDRDVNFFDYYRNERLDGSAGYRLKLNSNKDFEDIKLSIQYDDSFPISLDVSPSRGDKVKAFNMDIPVIGSCFKIYHHFYDINYPLLLHLSGGDLTFAFATAVNIEHNEPKRSINPYSLGDYIYNPDQEQFCDNRLHKKEVLVKDKTTSQYIEGADVSYQCVRFNCDIGKTQIPKLDGVPLHGSVPVLDGRFPACENGFLAVSKEGYVEEVVQVSVNANTNSQALPVVELTPIKKLNVVVIPAELDGNSIVLRPIDENEIALVSLTAKDGSYDDTYVYSRKISEGQSGDDLRKLNLQDPLEIVMEDKDYVLDVKLVKDGRIIGGLQIDSWKITRGEISSSDTLKLYAIVPSGDNAKIEKVEDFVPLWNSIIIPRSGEFAPVLE